MFSPSHRKSLATALAGAALASAMVVSGASADQHAIDAAAREEAGLPSVPAEPRQDLRSPDSRDRAEGYAPTLESQPVVDEPSSPSGFDWVSALIGAAAAAGLSLVVVALFGNGRTLGRRPASA